MINGILSKGQYYQNAAERKFKMVQPASMTSKIYLLKMSCNICEGKKENNHIITTIKNLTTISLVNGQMNHPIALLSILNYKFVVTYGYCWLVLPLLVMHSCMFP
jgi:hypothetical protein